MQRIGRMSKLKPGTAAEYDRRHNGVWPEVRAALDEAGIANYTIFRHGDWLFSYFELGNGQQPETIGDVFERVPACRRWEEQMRELRDPGFAADWLPMKEVFYQP